MHFNPAFEGWIFEFDVDYQLDKAHRDQSKFCSVIRSPTADGTPTEQERSVDKYMAFESVVDLSNAIKSLPTNQVLWAKPKLWCQPAFDFLCIWKDLSSSALNMVVTNATRAQTHSVLLGEVRKLAVDLGKYECAVSAIRFDFIVPKDAQFTFGELTGRLCEWQNLQGGQWPNAPTCESHCSLQCLVVAEIVPTQK